MTDVTIVTRDGTAGQRLFAAKTQRMQRKREEQNAEKCSGFMVRCANVIRLRLVTVEMPEVAENSSVEATAGG